jgi:hypothetical protein
MNGKKVGSKLVKSMKMTNANRFDIIEKAVLDWIDLAYEKNNFSIEEIQSIELFWEGVVNLVSDNLETDYFEQD